MAASAKRDLFISINGDASGLSTATKAGRTALLELSNATGSIVDQISANMKAIGASATAPLAEMERNFRGSLKNIRDELRTLSASGDAGATLKFFDQNSINAQIAQGERLTAQYRQIAEAAQQVSAAGGANSEAAKVWAASYGTLAASTELETEKLRQQASAQTEVLGRIVTGTGAQIEAGKRVIVSSGQQRAAMQQLSYQIGDVSQGFALGVSPMVIFSQQSGQVIQALTMMTGSGAGWLGTVAKFAPYIGAALVVLTPFIAKLFESNDALADGVDKLKKDAAQTEATRLATAAYTNTIEGQIAAQRKLNDELDRSIRTQRQIQQNNLRDSQQRVSNFQSSRPGLVQDIQTQAALVARYQTKIDNGLDPEAATGIVAAAAEAQERLKELRAQLTNLDASIAAGLRGIREAQVPLIQNDVEAQLDKNAAAARRYDIALGNLNQRLAIGSGNKALKDVYQPDGTFAKVEVEGIGVAEYRRERARIEARKKADEKAARDAEAAARTTTTGTITDFGSPVRSGTITGRFGDNRGDHTHKGTDYAVPVGTPVYATADGKVNRAGLLDPKGYGNLIEIDSGAGTKERFGHLSEIKVKLGEIVAKGDLIGYSGGAKGAPGAGDSQGPHLHYEVLRNGRAVDPSKGRYPTDIVAKGNEGTRAQDTEEQKADAYRRSLDQANAENLRARRALVDKTDDELAVQLDQIAARKEALDAQVDAAVKEGKIPGQTAEEIKLNADKLKALYRDTALTEGIAATRADIARKARDELDIADNRARNDVDYLRLQESLATTLKERRRLALEALDKDYKAQRVRLSSVVDDPNATEKDRAIARDNRDALDRAQPDRVKAENKRNAGPLDQFRDQLKAATGDMDEALQGVAVHGLQSLEDGLLGVINGTESVGSAFKKMAASIIADLARIAIEKAIVKGLELAFGASDGHIGGTGGTAVHPFATGLIPGFADGVIRGPGTGTSDSILGLMQGRGLIRVSNGESIITADATRRFGPLLKAMNDNRIPGFAGGDIPSWPSLPAAESMRSQGNAPIVIHLATRKGDAFETEVLSVSGPHTVRILQAAAPGMIDAATSNTVSHLNRPALSGQFG